MGNREWGALERNEKGDLGMCWGGKGDREITFGNGGLGLDGFRVVLIFLI